MIDVRLIIHWHRFLLIASGSLTIAPQNPLERERKRDTLSEFIINGSISYV